MENLNYDEIMARMNEINTIFGEYIKILSCMDTAMNDNINNGEESAINSLLGGKFLKKWEKTSRTFTSFKNDFDAIYAKVGQVTKNTAQLEEETTDSFYGSMDNTTSTSTTSDSTSTSTTSDSTSTSSGEHSTVPLNGVHINSQFQRSLMQ